MKYIKKLIYVLLLTVATQVATAQIKILYGPYLQNVKENEATIVWVADKPSIGWVLSHEGINVIYGRVAASDVYRKNALTFTTCDPNKKETSFVMINDIHGRENIITKLLNNANY